LSLISLYLASSENFKIWYWLWFIRTRV